MYARMKLRWGRLRLPPGLILLIPLAVGLLWPSLGEAQDLEVAGAVLIFFSKALTTGMLIHAERRFRHAPATIAWRLWTATFLLWTIADAIRIALLTQGENPAPRPSLENLVELAGYLAAIGSLSGLRGPASGRYGRARNLVDLGIWVTGFLALGWMVLVQPAVGLKLLDPIGAFWLGQGPVLDVLVAVLLLRLLTFRAPGGERAQLGVLFIAFALLAWAHITHMSRLLLADSGYSAWSLAAWTGSMLLCALPPRMGSFLGGLASAGTSASRPGMFSDRAELLAGVALVYAVVGVTLIDWWISDRLMGVGAGASIVITTLLVARQGIIAGQSAMRAFAALVNASADMAFIAAADGRILMANPAMLSATGHMAGESAAMSLEGLLGEQTPAGSILKAAVEGAWSGEVGLLRRDGSRLPAALSLRPIRDERRATPLLAGTAHDLTTVKQREIELRRALDEVGEARSQLEQLNRELEAKVEARTKDLAAMVENLARLNEELKALDRLKTEFVALVSHELRAPLTNIRSGIELVLSSGEGPQDHATQSLRLVGEETERLTRFVEAILDLSTLEAGKYPIHMVPISLREAAETVIARFPEGGGRERIHVKLPDGLPDVLADERSLGSVLFHLMDNAVKYAPSGEILLTAQVEGERVLVRVLDHGPGIPPEDRERVFELFHRLDSRDSREVYGHGLGLFTAKRMVEAMGGTIFAEEPPGGGACFVVSLRARRQGE